MSAPTLLVVAKLSPERRRTLELVGNEAGLELHVIHDSKIASSWAARNDPRAVLIDAKLETCQELCCDLRGQRRLAKVPILALAPEHDDPLTEQYYGWGIDDVVPADAGVSLIERLSRIVQAGRLAPTAGRGRAVVADPDRNRCNVIGRVLHNAGYELSYATDEHRLLGDVLGRIPALVVMNAAIAAPRAFIQAARHAGSRACWVVTSPRRELETCLDAVADMERVAVTAAFGPVENILYLSNEMLNARTDALRRNSRLLCGTLVWYRPPGEAEDDTGYTYNVSTGGMYVRTLAPPSAEQLWLELRPPHQRRRVRLLARVVWRRPFGDNALAAVPAGFGVEIVGGLGDGGELWRRGVDSLLAPSASAERGADPGPQPLMGRVASLSIGLPEVSAAERAAAPAVEARAAPAVEAPAAPGSSEPPPAPVEPPEALPPPTASPASQGLSGAWPFDEYASGLPDASAAGTRDAAAEVPLRVESRVDGEARPQNTRSPWALVAILGMVTAGALLAGYRALRSGAEPEGSRPASPPPPKPWKHGPQGDRARSGFDSVVAPPAPAAVVPARAAELDRDAAVAVPAEPVAKASTEPPDAAGLSDRDGFLFVEYPAQAHVYLNGINAGATGEWLTVKCGTRFIRVGTSGKVPRWLTVGQSTVVGCRRPTRVTFGPAL
jgi:hypothetical protein